MSNSDNNHNPPHYELKSRDAEGAWSDEEVSQLQEMLRRGADKLETGEKEK